MGAEGGTYVYVDKVNVLFVYYNCFDCSSSVLVGSVGKTDVIWSDMLVNSTPLWIRVFSLCFLFCLS